LWFDPLRSARRLAMGPERNCCGIQPPRQRVVSRSFPDLIELHNGNRQAGKRLEQGKARERAMTDMPAWKKVLQEPNAIGWIGLIILVIIIGAGTVYFGGGDDRAKAPAPVSHAPR
jgi:hypothetical protein